MGACISAEQETALHIPGACPACCRMKDKIDRCPLLGRLDQAITYGHVSCLKAIIAAGVLIDGIEYYRPLHFAVEKGQPGCVTALLAAGADADVKNSEGLTALRLASALGQVECKQLLLAHSTRPSGRTPPQPQRQQAAAQPRGQQAPARGAHQQDLRQRQQLATQRLLSGVRGHIAWPQWYLAV